MYWGKLGLSSSSISMSTSSLSTIVLVSTSIFSFTKTSSVITFWLVLLITTCLNVEWAWWMFNPLKDLKRGSHKVHIWAVVLLPFCSSAGQKFTRVAKKKCHFKWVPVMILSWNFHKFSREDWRLLCYTETFEFACVSAHVKQVLTCDRSRGYEFHFLKTF